MRFVKAATAALFILSTLALAGPASADPGQYRYDICHDTGIDTIVGDHFNFEVTCSTDAGVQGYGGNGADVFAYVEVKVVSTDGDPVAVYNDGLRPTGVVVTETGNNPAGWAYVYDYELVIPIPEVAECTINVSGFCNPETAPVPVIVPAGAGVDTGKWVVDVHRDGQGGFVRVDACADPFTPASCAGGAPIETDLLPIG